MAWAFQPINNICLDCGHDIDPCAERNYIVWDSRHSNGKGKPRGTYRRECAKCHDIRLERPYNREKSTDALAFNMEPEPTLKS